MPYPLNPATRQTLRFLYIDDNMTITICVCSTGQPRSLLDLCKTTIRRQIGTRGLHQSIDLLPLPTLPKNYLKMIHSKEEDRYNDEIDEEDYSEDEGDDDGDEFWCVCGRSFSTKNGMKSHRTRMRCKDYYDGDSDDDGFVSRRSLYRRRYAPKAWRRLPNFLKSPLLEPEKMTLAMCGCKKSQCRTNKCECKRSKIGCGHLCHCQGGSSCKNPSTKKK